MPDGRINNGGARLGSGAPVAKSTIAARAFKERIAALATKDAGLLYQALRKKALGDDKQDPDVPAIKEIFDRILGRAPQAIDLTSGGEKIGSSMKMLSPEAQERMRQLYEEDMMRQTIEGKIIPKQLE